MKETIKKQEITLSQRLSKEKEKMQKAWQTKLKSPVRWFRETKWHFSSESIEGFKRSWKEINSKKPLHKNAYLLMKNLFKTLDYAFTGLAILLNDLIQTVLIIARNTAIFCRDVARVFFCGLGLLAEGITWIVTTPINALLNWAKKPSKNPETQVDVRPEAPVVQPQQPAQQFTPSIQASYSTENGVNISTNVKIPESLESAGRQLFGARS